MERDSDVLFWDASFGMYLREARHRAGYSLRDLEKRSGISDSEIHKIEAGNQQCRLSSFIYVCAALGLPCGLVLDQVVSSSMAFFRDCLERDSGLAAFIGERWSLNTFGQRAVTDQLACICSTVAHLIRCTNARRKAASFQYPDPSTEAAFKHFSEVIDATTEGLERLSILRALEQTPTAELLRQNVECPHLLESVANQALRVGKRGRKREKGIVLGEGVAIWWPVPPPPTPFTGKKGD